MRKPLFEIQLSLGFVLSLGCADASDSSDADTGTLGNSPVATTFGELETTTSTGSGEPSSTSAEPASGPILIIEGAAIFDGESLIPGGTVVVQDGFIVEVGSTVAMRDPSEGAIVIDGRGLTLLPGLIDSHTHTFSVAELAEAARFGVTTELDMLSPPGLGVALRAESDAGTVGAVADVRSAGNGVLAPRGFGTHFGTPYATLDNPADADAFVAERLAEGSDYIKILQDDGSLWNLEWPALEGSVVSAVIAAAHAREVVVVAHAPKASDALHAVHEGIDGLIMIYGGGANPALIEGLEQTGAFLIPTMGFALSLCGEPTGAELAADPDLAPFLSAAMADELERLRTIPDVACGQFRDALEELVASDVTLLAGTDCPQPGIVHGVTLHGELEMFVDMGMDPLDALKSATSAAADAFGLSDRGRIAAGLRADLVLVEGDPTLDITRTRAIRRVFVRGVEVMR